jgi:hypothetical protein
MEAFMPPRRFEERGPLGTPRALFSHGPAWNLRGPTRPRRRLWGQYSEMCTPIAGAREHSRCGTGSPRDPIARSQLPLAAIRRCRAEETHGVRRSDAGHWFSRARRMPARWASLQRPRDDALGTRLLVTKSCQGHELLQEPGEGLQLRAQGGEVGGLVPVGAEVRFERVERGGHA